MEAWQPVLTLPYRTTDDTLGTSRRAPGLEAATDADGRVHALLYGTSDTSPDVQLSVYVRLGLDGHVEIIDPTPELFSAADPGGPSHLGVRPGGRNPWLMVVGDDAVQILERGY